MFFSFFSHYVNVTTIRQACVRWARRYKLRFVSTCQPMAVMFTSIRQPPPPYLTPPLLSSPLAQTTVPVRQKCSSHIPRLVPSSHVCFSVVFERSTHPCSAGRAQPFLRAQLRANLVRVLMIPSSVSLCSKGCSTWRRVVIRAYLQGLSREGWCGS